MTKFERKKTIMKQLWCNFIGNLKKWCILALYQHNHWVRVGHIGANEITSIGSDYVLAPGGAKLGIFLVRPLGTNFSEILIEIHIFIPNDVWKMVNSVAKYYFLLPVIKTKEIIYNATLKIIFVQGCFMMQRHNHATYLKCTWMKTNIDVRSISK